MEDKYRKKVGEKLKNLRQRYDYTQEDIARIAGVGANSITNYESGRRLPDYLILQKVADFFGVSTDYIIREIRNGDVWHKDLPIELREIVLDPDNDVWIQMIPLFRKLDLEPDEVRDIVKALAKIKNKHVVE